MSSEKLMGYVIVRAKTQRILYILMPNGDLVSWRTKLRSCTMNLESRLIPAQGAAESLTGLPQIL